MTNSNHQEKQNVREELKKLKNYLKLRKTIKDKKKKVK